VLPTTTTTVQSRLAALPEIEIATRRCTRTRRCRFTIIPSATTTTVRATLKSIVRRRCGRRRCARTRTRTLQVRASGDVFRIGATKLARGRHVLRLVAVDADGRKALRGYRLSFSLS
jgi:hypothetical protein